MVRDNEVRRVQQNQPETSEELSVEGIARRRHGLWVPLQERWNVDVYWQKAPRSESQSHCAVTQARLPSAPVLLSTAESLPFVKIVWLFGQFSRNEAHRKFILRLFKPHKAFHSFPSRRSITSSRGRWRMAEGGWH